MARLTARWTRIGAIAAAGLCLFAVVGWQGVTTAGRAGGIDAGEHTAYAQYLDEHGRLPPRAVNYEFASPPLFHVAAIAANAVLRDLPSTRVELPWNWATRALWLALVGGGVAAMTAVASRRRRAGLAALGLAALWGLDECASLARTEPWSAGRLVALACGAGLLAVTGLLAREVWPARPRLWLAAGAAAAAYPVVYRMSILFHPEMPFALLCGLALLVFLRASRRGWPPRSGLLLGLVLAAAADTRQPAVLVLGCLALWAAVVGRRTAVPFALRAALVTVLVAGPWWGYAAWRWHNPLQSNLEPRASLMLDHQPLSFYLSFPIRDLVLHPYRPRMAGELLPQLHAELWSDWFGALHPFLGHPSTADRITASTQSVLGLPADLLGLGGLALLGLPAAGSALRRRARPAEHGPAGQATPEAALGLLAFVTVAALAAFVLELIRFPQRYGDPIKSSYLLFTAPCWAILLVACWTTLAARSRALGRLLTALAVLYAASYTADLAAALSHPAVDRPTGGLAGIVDLSTTFQQTSPTPGLGGEVDFLVGVGNAGNQTASDVTLTVTLPAGLKLLGAPFYERGTGCTGDRTLTCNLGFLAGSSSTLIRFGVDVTEPGKQTMTATATAPEPDANPADDTSSFSLDLPG